jgi:hypothetical protein
MPCGASRRRAASNTPTASTTSGTPPSGSLRERVYVDDNPGYPRTEAFAAVIGDAAGDAAGEPELTLSV